MRSQISFLLLVAISAASLLSYAQARKRLRKAGGGGGGRQHSYKLPLADNSVYETDSNMISQQMNEIETLDQLNQGIVHLPHQYDPCEKRRCGAGQICKISEDGEPLCICIPTCPDETDPRRKVCSNLNQTWSSDCQLNQMRCWCEGADERCLSPEFAHHHIDYYGHCKIIEECTDDQMLDFPRRMRDWLFHVMRDMADREELSPYYQRMERQAESDHTKRWTSAALWKWCDLDSGQDRSVSRHELFPILAPLKALEQCIAPFLDSCDANGDHKITLQEWTHCLELDQEDIEEQCEEIRENQ